MTHAKDDTILRYGDYYTYPYNGHILAPEGRVCIYYLLPSSKFEFKLFSIHILISRGLCGHVKIRYTVTKKVNDRPLYEPDVYLSRP